MWVQVPFLAPAGMAELVDALDSGSSEDSFMKVQVLLPAPKRSQFFCERFSFFADRVDKKETERFRKGMFRFFFSVLYPAVKYNIVQ